MTRLDRLKIKHAKMLKRRAAAVVAIDEAHERRVNQSLWYGANAIESWDRAVARIEDAIDKEESQ